MVWEFPKFKRIRFEKKPLKLVLVRIPQDPDGEIENSGKSIFEIRNQNFCYIQVIVFDLKLFISGGGWDLASPLP